MSPKRTADFKAGRREAILAAAERCFATRGYDRTTTREIAAEAGLSTGAIYTYFKTKAAILDAICREEAASRQAALREQLAALPPDSKRFTAAFALALGPLLTLSRAEIRRRERSDLLLWYEATRDPEVAASIRQLFTSWRETAARLLEGERASGRLRGDLAPDTLATILVAAPLGLMLCDLLGDADLDWQASLDTLGAILEGVVTAGATAATATGAHAAD